MEKFIKHCIGFVFILLFIHWILALLANVSTDSYYQKLASPKQNSLVLGTSRALQGIIPSVIDSVIENKSNEKLYNFAFTVKSSSFGEVYFNAIKSKLDQFGKEGYHIVTVDPWSISEPKESILGGVDDQSVLKGLNNFSASPNFEYLFKKYPSGWGMIGFKRIEMFILKNLRRTLNSNITGSFSELDENGWLNVYTSMDSSWVKKKEGQKFKEYYESSENRVFSPSRYSYLLKTIKFLKSKGPVYVVRLPVHKQMLYIENKFVVDFDNKIIEAITLCDGYLDMNVPRLNDFKFTDGHHLYKDSAHKVSIEIGNWIRKLN